MLNNFSPASFDALVIAAAMPQTSGVNFCDFTYVLGPSSATDHEPFRLLLTFLGRFSAIASTIRVLTLRAEVCDNHRLSYRTLFDVLLLTLQLAEFRLDGMAWHSGAPFPAPLGVARHLRHLQLKNMRNASTDSSFLDILTLVTEWHTVDLIDVVQQGSPQFARPASVRALSIAHTHLDASAVIPVPDLSPGVGALHALILVHVVHSEQTAIRALLHASRQTLRQLWISFSHGKALPVVTSILLTDPGQMWHIQLSGGTFPNCSNANGCGPSPSRSRCPTPASARTSRTMTSPTASSDC